MKRIGAYFTILILMGLGFGYVLADMYEAFVKHGILYGLLRLVFIGLFMWTTNWAIRTIWGDESGDEKAR